MRKLTPEMIKVRDRICYKHGALAVLATVGLCSGIAWLAGVKLERGMLLAGTVVTVGVLSVVVFFAAVTLTLLAFKEVTEEKPASPNTTMSQPGGQA